MIKYYHELRPEEYEWLKKEGTTWQELNDDFPRPPWCTMHEAVTPFGCWSLTCRLVTGEEFCETCEYKEKT